MGKRQLGVRGTQLLPQLPWTPAAQQEHPFPIMLCGHWPCKANQRPSALAQEQAAAVPGTAALQPHPGARQATRGMWCFGVQPCLNYSQCGLETHVSAKSSKLCFQGKRRMGTCFPVPLGWFK